MRPGTLSSLFVTLVLECALTTSCMSGPTLPVAKEKPQPSRITKTTYQLRLKKACLAYLYVIIKTLYKPFSALVEGYKKLMAPEHLSGWANYEVKNEWVPIPDRTGHPDEDDNTIPQYSYMGFRKNWFSNFQEFRNNLFIKLFIVPNKIIGKLETSKFSFRKNEGD